MQYEYQEHGVAKGSELFLSTPSRLAESLFFYLHRCGRFVCTPQYRIIRNNFNNYLLFYMEKGRMHVENEGKTYIAKPGDMGFINCHLPHAYIAMDETTIFSWVHFSGSNTHDFYEHIVRRNNAVFPLPEGSPVRYNLDCVINLNRREDVVDEQDMSIHLHSILCQLLFIANRENESDSIRNPAIEQALRYIKSHYREPIEVQDLANEVNLSLYHFSRQFKQNVGYAPHEYITILRINAAKDLLKSTDLPISEIGRRVGYEYPTSFISVFTRKVGSSPKKFRDMLI